MNDKKKHYKKTVQSIIFYCAAHPDVALQNKQVRCMENDDDKLREEKRSLRRFMHEQRKLAFAKNPEASLALRNIFIREVSLPSASLIATTLAIKDEIDPAPLHTALMATGHRLCLPVITQPGQPLLFRAWSPGEPLAGGRFGIPEPLSNSPEVLPNVFLVPLLAFDRKGNRLGQGGGYYDRTLATARKQTNILAIGLGFAAQEVLAVPTGPRDEPLDAIVTETDVFWVTASGF